MKIYAEKINEKWQQAGNKRGREKESVSENKENLKRNKKCKTAPQSLELPPYLLFFVCACERVWKCIIMLHTHNSHWPQKVDRHTAKGRERDLRRWCEKYVLRRFVSHWTVNNVHFVRWHIYGTISCIVRKWVAIKMYTCVCAKINNSSSSNRRSISTRRSGSEKRRFFFCYVIALLMLCFFHFCPFKRRIGTWLYFKHMFRIFYSLSRPLRPLCYYWYGCRCRRWWWWCWRLRSSSIYLLLCTVGRWLNSIHWKDVNSFESTIHNTSSHTISYFTNQT